MIDSFFAVNTEHKFTFKELSLEAKKSIITRWGLECDGLEGLIDDSFYEKKHLSEADWSLVIATVEASKGDMEIFYLDVPVEKVKSIVLANIEDGDFTTWEAYATWYGLRDVPNYSQDKRWPCLSCSGDDEVFEDGWHRMHSYINNNHSTIPVVVY